ncbi:ABC transporter ATP-binding protein [Microvirga sp. W0021]|uniref:ABC transporter ATP-binding protein n=1 Tax=Hohaiivirga grylli TaxID=3133970 RepID=A0ABV0BJ19_9HYPH
MEMSMTSVAGTHEIKVLGVNKVFGDAETGVVALKDIDLTIQHGEFVCLLGPSGCGKSTLLNAVAGFSLPSTGDILVKDVSVTKPGPDRGMVFQEYALFPWMDVAKNIGFGLEIKGTPQAEREAIVERLMQKLGLSDFRNRFPKDLSGGMRQRVAIARVLALDPPIMLMDEPFGALDALTRRSLQDELLRIWEEERKTIIFVTHSIEEAIYLGSRVVVLTYRPGTVKTDITIDIPRPRDTSSAAFNDMKRKLGALVMEEHQRFSEDERRGGTFD